MGAREFPGVLIRLFKVGYHRTNLPDCTLLAAVYENDPNGMDEELIHTMRIAHNTDNSNDGINV